ncbi:MarR family transcriptional regulator [Plantactinospora sp. KLBMP9567]|uniref:MarR family winged helix-turn-helix transcriptional regulator n=1 Tax=Plantactinospora sp. KLBMP9567 TaxID=3085900 RepID=UPI002980D572|nr:MarR family transcriptional regulator [Plantactinospora sp. KLBMP9567]MDW5322424.1 MarR family transcriptional regulator [Plantactinospora sp. KLBMP9567]
MPGSGPRPPSLLALPSYLASQVSRFGRRHLERVLQEHDLVLEHHAILTALDDFGPLSQQQLADSLDLDKSHLVGRIDHLEGRRLLSRAPDPADRRRHRITLTATGRNLIRRLRPVARESQEDFLRTLSPAERKTLVGLLGRVLAANDAARRAGAATHPVGGAAGGGSRPAADAG